MKKKIISFLLALFIIVASLPLYAFATGSGTGASSNTSGSAQDDSSKPLLRVTSLYGYRNMEHTEDFRAQPDFDGVFKFYIYLDGVPEDGGDVIAYYRTIDDTAVAEWGDYESVGSLEDAYVTLSQSNGYKVCVTVKSSILKNGFLTPNMAGEFVKSTSYFSRRFIFEVYKTEGADVNIVDFDTQQVSDRCNFYCHLMADVYHKQNNNAGIDNSEYRSSSEQNMELMFQVIIDEYYKYGGEGTGYTEYFAWQLMSSIWDGICNKTYPSLYTNLDRGALINTPKLTRNATYGARLNLAFDDTWRNYLSSGWCDIGVSLEGILARESKSGEGPVTFHLYYNYQGVQRRALTLYLQGKFNESTHFGWQQAFSYAIDGLGTSETEKFIEDNFVGFTVYDNDGNVAYEVKMDDRSDSDIVRVCNDLNRLVTQDKVVLMLGNTDPVYTKEHIYEREATTVGEFVADHALYYLRLPSNFALADSYAYSVVSESTNSSEVRWVEDANLAFVILAKGKGEPAIERIDGNKLMVTSNVDTLKDGDSLKVMIRFDQPVYVSDPDNCYITLNVNGTFPVKLKVRPTGYMVSDTERLYYACDTLVFEGSLQGFAADKIDSLRNMKLDDGVKTGSPGIRGYVSGRNLVGKTLVDLYGYDKDVRSAEVKLSVDNTEGSWSKSKSIDVYLNIAGTGSRFVDYATVYYQWSYSAELPETYDSSIVFHTARDGETMKTIIGTGNGETYLHMKTVSAFGKTTISDRFTGTYDPNLEGATYTPFGPYFFDNSPPEILREDITIHTDDSKEYTVSVNSIPDDMAGLSTIALYYVPNDSEDGNGVLLKRFTLDDFKGTPRKLSHVISYEDVGMTSEDDWSEFDFYWVLTDTLGNVSVPSARFSLAFDTKDYLTLDAFAPDGVYADLTEKLDRLNYIYDFTKAQNQTVSSTLGDVFYSIKMQLDISGFIGQGGEDSGEYNVVITHKGVALTEKGCNCLSSEDDDCECAQAGLTACDHNCTCDSCNYNEFDYVVLSETSGTSGKRSFTVNIYKPVQSGQYKIYLKRTQNGNVRTSQIYSIYATNLQSDNTTTKQKVDVGTLLINTVYRLSATDPYYYYKDSDGVTQKEYYNGERQPATFSNSAKAREYVLFCEYADIYLYEIPSFAIADALNSGAPGYLKADGETTEAEAGQFWIRYKSKSWTPTSGDSAWVYYFYGSDKLSREALSANVLEALNTVATRIVGYGKSINLTDNSLFLGNAIGEKLLDSHGMPYLLDAQIHNTDEQASVTKCNNTWSIPIVYAGDRNIYRSVFELGSEASGNLKEYPIVGYFDLSDSSIYQYMTLADYEKFTNPQLSSSVSWNNLTRGKGQNFVDIFTGSGIYYIREMSEDGVCVYPICIDQEAPEVTFEVKTSADGELKRLTLNGNDQLKISAMQLYVGEVAVSEYDSLAYVAIYKMSTLALVNVYTAQDLKRGSMKIDDGKYYIVVADRSGNSYTITADINITALECDIKESKNSYIKLTCNRIASQIMVYEVYLNGNLVTSTYSSENTFRDSGTYSIYIRDIYGNEYTKEYDFVRNYPELDWKYLGSDGKYHTYDKNETEANGFVMTKISDGNYRISTAVKTRFVLADGYQYDFIGVAPSYTVGSGTEHNVTIEEGQSFTLKVYYKNHPDCYTIYTGVVDVTPPSISVVADEDLVGNGEDLLYDDWIEAGKIGLDKLYLVLNGIGRTNVVNGGSVNSDIIKINASDANDLSTLEVYLDGTLIERQDRTTTFSQIIVNRGGNYRIVAKDTLGNVSEFTFINGMPDVLDYFVDGEKKEIELHSADYFNSDYVYTKVDYGKSDFALDVKENADVFISMQISGGEAKIYGFRITDGNIYPLSYEIVEQTRLNPDTNQEYKVKSVELVEGAVILNTVTEGFKAGKEYLIKEDGPHKIFASVSEDMTVRIKVYASNDDTKILSINARVEFITINSFFVSAEISNKSSNVSFEDLGLQSGSDIRSNDGFTVDESVFENERIESVRLYYSKLNDLDKDSVSNRKNIYVSGQKYTDEGFYLLVVRNRFGIEKTYRISVSRSFGITSSVVFADGHRIYYSKDYSNGILYSDDRIILDLLDEQITVTATRDGVRYDNFVKIAEGGISYLIFSEEGSYNVTLADSYGNALTRQLEINKSSYSVAEELLVGFNEKALKRDEGYTNQKLSIDKAVVDSEGIFYLAIRFGETETVLFDAFAEEAIFTDEKKLVDAVGAMGDGVYTVVCRNRYGAVVNREIHYRETPTLKLERTTRSNATPEIYDLNYALSLGFWSNNTLVFSTEASTYVFTVNGNVTECPRTLVFENAGDYGSFEYDITYIDEYGFEYSFKAYLLRRNITIDVPASITGLQIDGVLNTQSDIFITFGENIYATYTRNSGEEVVYHSGEVLKKDGAYRFTVIDYAGNASTLTLKKDTAVEYSFEITETGTVIQNGGVVNSSKISFKAMNKDSAYIEKVLRDGELQTDFTGSKFTGDGKWEIILADKLGNKSYFSFYIVTKAQNGFEYTTPYEYRISEMWYDGGDGVKVSYMSFVTHTDSGSHFSFTENGKYTAVMSSDATGISSTFEFYVNTTAPDVQLVGCKVGETTINDVSLAGCKIGDRIKVYMLTDSGEKLIDEIEVSMASTKMPTITEGGKYRIVVESEAGVETELTFERKHVMNTAGSVFIMVVIGLSVVGLFTGLVYRNKSKTDD